MAVACQKMSCKYQNHTKKTIVHLFFGFWCWCKTKGPEITGLLQPCCRSLNLPFPALFSCLKTQWDSSMSLSVSKGMQSMSGKHALYTDHAISALVKLMHATMCMFTSAALCICMFIFTIVFCINVKCFLKQICACRSQASFTSAC